MFYNILLKQWSSFSKLHSFIIYLTTTCMKNCSVAYVPVSIPLQFSQLFQCLELPFLRMEEFYLDNGHGLMLWLSNTRSSFSPNICKRNRAQEKQSKEALCDIFKNTKNLHTQLQQIHLLHLEKKNIAFCLVNINISKQQTVNHSLVNVVFGLG